MKHITKTLSKVPSYLIETIEKESIPYLEQVRVKEYSKRLPPLEGQRVAVIPWSGGLDSTTSLIMAIEAGISIRTIFLNYGQPYIKKELLATNKLEKLIRAKYPEADWTEHYIVDVSFIDQLVKSKFNGEWGHIFPMRNFLILEESAAIAQPNRYTEVWFSSVQGEMPYSGGDKSVVFLTYMKEIFGKRNINLTTPLVGLTKADMVQWAIAQLDRFRIIRHTISCFNGEGDSHCGECQACFNRAVAFFAANQLPLSGVPYHKNALQNFGENYIRKLAKESYYSPTRRSQLQQFINFISQQT